MAIKYFLVIFLAVFLNGCKTEQVVSVPASKESCAQCHFAAKIFSALPANLRLKIDPLAESLSKGLNPVEIHPESPDHLSAETCRKCHKESYDSWKKSHHAQSWTDPLFRVAMKKEPMRWCVNCHAPLKEQQIAGSNSPLASEGINCAVCHVRNGFIYASETKRGDGQTIAKIDSDSKTCILPIKRTASISDGSLCAGCHQFNFPDNSDNGTNSDSLASLHAKTFRLGKVPMQNTVAEYGSSEAHAQGVSCSHCHFSADKIPTHDTQAGTGNSFHATFSDVKNPETGRPYMEVNLEMKNIAHSWPTGDLFRSVTLESLDNSGRQMDIEILARHYEMSDKTLKRDTTLHEDKTKDKSKTAKKTFILYYDNKPQRCRIVYHSQGLIESTLLRDFTREEIIRNYQRVLYDSRCIK